MWIMFVMLWMGQLPTPFPLSELQPGMHGVCHTVFQGNQIEPFAFEVKQRLPNHLGPQKDLVLVRLLGEKTDFTGVVAGMSGSPCFIKDRLLGALSYSFGGGFSKEPIAGITPIEDMYQVWRRVVPALPWRQVASQAGQDDAARDWQLLRGEPAALQEVAASSSKWATADGLRPIATPVTLAGVPTALQSRFAAFLGTLGWQSQFTGMANAGAAGPAATSDLLQPAPIVPGAPLAVVMATGDMEIAGTGTITVVDQGDVLAFGHPNQGYGTVSLPFAGAHIVHTLASLRASHKMSVAGPIVGELVQDRLSAIAGRIGQIPQMVPVKGSLQVGTRHKTFAMQLARDRYLTPRLLFMALLSGLTDSNEGDLRGTLRMQAIIELDKERLVLEVVESGERQDILGSASFTVAQAFEQLWEHQYGPPPPMAITVEAVLNPTPMVETIERLTIDRQMARPGDKMEIVVGLRDGLGQLRQEQFTVHIPATWAGQQLTVVAAGHGAAEKLRKQQQGHPALKTRRDVVDWLQARYAPGRLWLFVTSKTVGVGGLKRTYDFLPPSATLAWSGQSSHPLLRMGVLHSIEQTRAGIVQGEQACTIKIGAML